MQSPPDPQLTQEERAVIAADAERIRRVLERLGPDEVATPGLAEDDIVAILEEEWGPREERAK